MMCRLYAVTGGGYYAWKKRAVIQHAQEDLKLKRLIKGIFNSSRGTYGSPRVFESLKRKGISIGKKRVARLMQEMGLKARSVKIYRRMAGKHRLHRDIPNRQYKIEKLLPDKVWVGDITYLRCSSGWRFLAVVMDKCTRKIVGWALGINRDVKLTIAALNHAIKNRRQKPGLIFHSDRGIEYVGFTFRRRLKELGIVQSANRPCRMNDNSAMESFFHSLKSDEYHKKTFQKEEDLKLMIKSYLPFYNKKRMHSSLKYLSPLEYEATLC